MKIMMIFHFYSRILYTYSSIRQYGAILSLESSSLFLIELLLNHKNKDFSTCRTFWPRIIFSPVVEKHIDKLADIHSVHLDSLAVILMNFVATSLEFSFVLRTNSITNKISTNIYNIIVARSCKFLFYF